MEKTLQTIMTILRLFSLFITLTTLISCSSVHVDSPAQVTPTPSPTSFTRTPKPSATAKYTASIIPSPTQPPVCIEVNGASKTDGWDCINQSYGFTVHFPSTAKATGPLGDTLIVWLQNNPSNPRVERMVSITLGEGAESCISADLETMQVGEQKFFVNHGFEPSGVVYEWRSYGNTKESKSVCFVFTVGFRTWEQNDPLFPPEKDHGLEEVEAILATFRWLDP